jgi:uncharacterized phiE125 gp8 family phage protein
MDIQTGTHPIVFVNSLLQVENVHYTVTNGDIVFVVPPITGDAIRVWYTTDPTPDQLYDDMETPSGTPNGVLTAFTLTSAIAAGSHPLVFLNEFFQIEGIHYTWSGNTITFSLPPLTGDAIRVWYNTTGYALEPGADDALITDDIEIARKYCEEYQSRAYITQTWEMVLDAFPDDDEYITLQRAPLISVTHVKYRDSSGTLQTMSASDYVVDTYSEPGRIYLAKDESWPTTYGQANDITIRYVSGYGATAASVPMHIKHAILMMLAHIYENREGVSSIAHGAVPFGITDLLNLDRIIPV